jgi:MazG family protein
VTPSQPDPAPPAHAPDPPADSGDVVAAGHTALDRALQLVRFLRANCEWDAAQTPHTLLPYLLEEAHETADAVAAGDDEALRSELGDLLLNVAFQIVLAEERRAFTADDVLTTLESKMRRRHPHLYGDGPRVDWETLKQQERDAERERERVRGRDRERDGVGVADPAVDGSLLDGIAGGLEPLSKAQRMQERVAAVGFDWPSAQGAFDKVVEEVDEVRELLESPDRDRFDDRIEDEVGDLLFAVVNLARLSGTHAMRALMRANDKFAGRFRALERLALARGVVIDRASLEELDVLWDEVKAEERRGPV